MTKIKNYLNFVNEDADWDSPEGEAVEKDQREREETGVSSTVKPLEDGMSAENVDDASDLRAENAPETFIDTPQEMTNVATDNTVSNKETSIQSFNSYVDSEASAPAVVDVEITDVDGGEVLPGDAVADVADMPSDDIIDAPVDIDAHGHDHDVEGVEDMDDAEVDMDDIEEDDITMDESLFADKYLSKDGMSGGSKQKDPNPKDNPITGKEDVSVRNIKSFSNFADSLKAQDLSTDGHTKGGKKITDPNVKEGPISGKSDGKEVKAGSNSGKA